MNAPRYIVWDWNGTVIEDVQANVSSLNVLMDHFGKARVTVDEYREKFEVPIVRMFTRMGFAAEEYEANTTFIHRRFHEHYEEEVKNVGFRSGVRELIEATREAGTRHVIVSNHIVPSIKEHLERLSAPGLFDAILAHDSAMGQRTWKPKGERLRDYMTLQGWSAKDGVIVGDTPEEMHIGRELGLFSVAITGGFATNERLLKAKPDAMIDDYAAFPRDLIKTGVAA